MRIRSTLLGLAVILFSGVIYAADSQPAVPNRLEKAKIGEWASYTDGTEGTWQRHTLVRINGEGEAREYVLQVDYFEDGKNVRSETRNIALAKLEQGIKRMTERALSITNEEITVGNDKTIKAISIALERDGNRRIIYVSESVPVTGLVKMWNSDPEKPSLELVDFGD